MMVLKTCKLFVVQRTLLAIVVSIPLHTLQTYIVAHDITLKVLLSNMACVHQ